MRAAREGRVGHGRAPRAPGGLARVSLALAVLTLGRSCAWSGRALLQPARHRPRALAAGPPRARPRHAPPRRARAAEAAPGAGERGERGTGLGPASLNLAKNLVGSGVLSLPGGVAAFSASAGALGPAALLLALAALFSAYGFFLIGRVCEETGAKTFGGAWEKSVGRGAWVPRWTCLLECLGGSIVYAMVLGDVFSSLAAGVPALPALLCSRAFAIVAITALVLFPLCCLRTFGQLAKFSALGTMATSFVVVFVVKRFADGTYSPGGAFYQRTARPILDSAAGALDARILILASILSTAFLVHFNAPQMYAELEPSRPLDDPEEKSRKQAKFGKIAVLGFGLAAAQYALVMVFGFLTFGRFSDGNLLLNYSTADPWAVAGRVAIGASVLFGYPMQFAGLRSGLLEAFGRKESLPKGQHRLLTAALLSVVTFVACRFHDLGKFQAVEGALLASFLIYIAPPLMALRLWRGPAARLRYISVIALGVVVSIVGSVVTLTAP